MNSSLTELYLEGGVIHDDCVDMEIDDDLMIFVRWIMEPDWRFRSMGNWRGIEDEFFSHKTEFVKSMFLLDYALRCDGWI